VKIIHVIEDDPTILDAILMILELHNFHGDGYPDGLHIKEGAFKMPNLFLIDYQLPKLSGLEICKLLKGSPKYSVIPILLTSAQPNVKSYCLEGGAAAFIEKPFDMKSLIKTVNDHVK
jgi:two-component system, OmpR family, phosphate regulon response regulator PhoB